MEHNFTQVIRGILSKHFGEAAEDLFEKSPLLQYINLKTVSATRGSKSKSRFTNLYAIFVLVENYVAHGFHKKGDYSKCEGAIFKAVQTATRVSLWKQVAEPWIERPIEWRIPQVLSAGGRAANIESG